MAGVGIGQEGITFPLDVVFQTPLGMLVVWRGHPFPRIHAQGCGFWVRQPKIEIIFNPTDVSHGNPCLSRFSRQFCFLYLRKKFQSVGIHVVCSVFWWLPGASSNILMDAPLHPKLGYGIDFYPGFSCGINHPGLEKPQQVTGVDFLGCIHSFLQLSLPAWCQLSIFCTAIQD